MLWQSGLPQVIVAGRSRGRKVEEAGADTELAWAVITLLNTDKCSHRQPTARRNKLSKEHSTQVRYPFIAPSHYKHDSTSS
jgi:hypothetical protein